MSRYAIDGGREGKARLKLLARVMLPTTSQLLKRVGLSKGMKCLDVGCGGGDVTRLMASLVGPEGKVVGTDADLEVLTMAQQDAVTERLDNVEFHHTDASVCQGEDENDLVYARFLLTHLSDPEKCLNAMVKACKPHGLIVIEDIDFAGSFCYPPYPAYERYAELYQQVIQRRGGDPNIGPKLPGMLRRAGAEGVQVNVVQPTHLHGEGKFMAAITMERISDSVVSEDLATEVEVKQVISGLTDAAGDPETVISLPRVFQTWGRRA
ncbi:MAG TPA: methyltransferase domain-containing protein [Pyrinomonadaceae bacterium]